MAVSGHTHTRCIGGVYSTSGRAHTAKVATKKMHQGQTAIIPSWQLDFCRSVAMEDEPRAAQTVKAPPRNTYRRQIVESHASNLPQQYHAKPLTATERRMLERDQQVAAMRSVMDNAEALQARDQQIREKERTQSRAKQFEREMDDMMEGDRRRAIQHDMRKEEVIRANARERARVIDQQLNERQEQRLRQLDLLEIEKEDFKKYCDQRVAEENEQKEKKLIEARKRKEELVESNKMAIREKLQRAELEKQADDAIINYQRQKAVADEMRDQEKEMLRQQRDAEFQQMLIKQERTIDNRGFEDEKRMIAAFHAKDKQARDQRIFDKEQRKKDVEDLKVGWQQQKIDKAIMIARQAEQDRHETEMLQEKQLVVQAEYDRQDEKRQAAALVNADEVKSQIEKKSATIQDGRRKYLQTTVAAARIEETTSAAKIEQLRQESIAQMTRKGIPKKYWSKLDDTKIGLAPSLQRQNMPW